MRHLDGDVVVQAAGHEQHPAVVEVAAQRLVHMAHRAQLQHATQMRAGGRRYPCYHLQQLVFIHETPCAHVAVVADQTQPHRIGVGLRAAQQIPGAIRVAVRALAGDGEVLTQKFGFKGIVLRGRAHRDGNDVFQSQLPSPFSCANNLLWARGLTITGACLSWRRWVQVPTATRQRCSRASRGAR